MSDSIEPNARANLARDYASALRDFVSGAGEAALARAYEIGRMATTAGVGLLDIAILHHEALAEFGRATPGELAREAGQFLVEALSPYEMNLRAYQASARMLGLSETNTRQNSETDRAREQLRTILDATTALIYLKDADGRYQFVNAQFQRIFQLSREQVIGRVDDEILPAAVADALRTSDQQVLETRTPQELEQTVPERDGPHTFLSLKFPLVGDDGAVYGLCCVATDITERKQRDEALRRAVEAAEAANRELEAFSYSVAHDLRAPLRSIDGFGQALLEDFADNLNPRGRKYLGYVRESAQHMAQLIDDLLALSRVSRGDLHRSHVDLTAVCDGIAERLRAAEPDRQVEFAIERGVRAHGDARLLRAALENLIGNAWKFTSKRPRATIEFAIARSESPVVYTIRDNGAGFDMAYADKLFGVFQRLHSTADFEGTGIGLATVQRIVRRHGGRVWADGEVGRGAAFHFTLEEAPADPGEDEQSRR